MRAGNRGQTPFSLHSYLVLEKQKKEKGVCPRFSPSPLFPFCSYSRLGVDPQAMPEMMIFWMFEVPSTTCSDLASR